MDVEETIDSFEDKEIFDDSNEISKKKKSFSLKRLIKLVEHKRLTKSKRKGSHNL